MSDGKDLPLNQKFFVEEWVKDRNGKRAAIAAGYSEKTAEAQASRLLTNVKVRAYADALLEKISKKNLVDAEYVISTIKNTVERCQQAEPVMIKDGDEWVETGEYQFDSRGVLKGCELLGKHLKLFTEKTEVSGPGGGPIQNEVTIQPLAPADAYRKALGKE